MAAQDTGAQVTAWALDEAGKQCFTEDYGISASWFPQGVQLPGGVQMVPAWFLLISARNPLLGEGPLYHMVPLPGVVPAEALVRDAVGGGLKELRDLAASKLSAVNGGARVPLARGTR